MVSKKFKITYILASLSFLSYFSCITLILPIDRSGQINISSLVQSSGCRIKFVPSLNDCTNIVKESYCDAHLCGAVEDGRTSPYDKVNGQYFTSYFTFLIEHIEAPLSYTVPLEPEDIPYSQICFFRSSYKNNNNRVEQLYSRHVTGSNKFFATITNVNYKNYAGIIEIDYPEYPLNTKGYFTGIQPQGDRYIYDINQNYQGDINLVFSGNVIFTLESSYISISANALELILEDFKRQGIEYDNQPDKGHALYVNSIQKLKNIQLNLQAEDGSDFPINLSPQQYSRFITAGIYQLLLQPEFNANYYSLGYAALQGYYFMFDFMNYKLSIVQKADNQTNSS
ncbi:hypothetical protein ABPG72_019244 [Tetrahymena utriculariae]